MLPQKPTYEDLEQRIRELEMESSKLKIAEKELIHRKAQLNSIFMAAPIGIGLVRDRMLTWVNDRLCDILGYSSEDLLGMSARILYPDDAEFERVGRKKYAQIRYSGTGSVETRWKRKDGDLIDILLSSTPLVFDDWSKGVTFTALNISERKQVEKELQQSEEKYRQLVQNLPSIVFKGYNDWSIEFFDKKIERFTGYDSDEFNLKRMKWSDIILKEDIEAAKKIFIQAVKTNRSYVREYRIRSKAGDIHWVQERSQIVCDKTGQIEHVSGVFYDISKCKHAEKALRESEERYRSLVENTIYGFFIHEIPSGRFLFLNQRACELYGYTTQEGLNLTIWKALSPEDHTRIKKRVQARLEGNKLGPDIQTYTAVRKNGSTFRLEVSSSSIIFQDRPAVQGIIRDVTEQERLEAQLQQAQKMEAMGTLAGGIAHDFNNLLMGIQGRTSLMLMGSDSPRSYVEHLKGIEDYVKSAADLTNQLLSFAMGGKYQVKTTDLNLLIKNQNRMFGRTKKEIHIQEKFAETLWTVEVDQGQIEQMLLNIYVNAGQAMPGGGDLFILTENVIIDENYIKPYRVEPGRYAKISITDSGVGMDETTSQRIFDPFFTTKEMGRGTGLGLASAYGIVKNHDGFINVYSEKGEGTTFNIYFPASEKAAAKEQEIAGELVRGTETVLLVDDEDMIIEVGQGIIESLGYEVWIAKSGKEAIEIYNQNLDRIDLVILDMIMPGMGGRETYDNLKALNPYVKVLLSSGYSINAQAAEILNRGCNDFIQKPFNVTDLSKKIREILDVN